MAKETDRPWNLKTQRKGHSLSEELHFLSEGELKYGLTNDYMFRAVMQQNETALKGLLYALLSLPEGSIESVVIMNPIELGKTIDKKTCILDLKILLNNRKIINVEMQVNDYGNWPDRSLTYLCRSYDQLSQGSGYGEVMPTIHIGILDFNLKHLTPEFYSEFMLMNTKNHEVYSDKFVLRVLNLNVIEDEDIVKEPEELYHWAKLFKARSWEEIQMIAEKNPYIKEAVVTLHQMSEEEKIREQCEALEKYNWDLASATAKGHAAGLTEGEARGKEGIILICKSVGAKKEAAVDMLMKQYDMSEAAAYEEIEKYWK